MPHTDYDERHEGYGAVIAEDIDEDLSHWLAYGTVDRVVEVLDREEERDEEEEAEDR